MDKETQAKAHRLADGSREVEAPLSCQEALPGMAAALHGRLPACASRMGELEGQLQRAEEKRRHLEAELSACRARVDSMGRELAQVAHALEGAGLPRPHGDAAYASLVSVLAAQRNGAVEVALAPKLAGVLEALRACGEVERLAPGGGLAHGAREVRRRLLEAHPEVRWSAARGEYVVL